MSNPEAISSTTVAIGMSTLNAVTMLFERAKTRTPNQLMTTNTAIRPIAIAIPSGVSRSFSKTPGTNVDMYCTVPEASVGGLPT